MKFVFRLVSLFAIVFSTLFFSCEKDSDVNVDNAVQSRKMDVVGHFVKGDSIRNINKNLDLFIGSRFEQRNTSSSEDITSSIYGFTLDTDRILQLSGSTYTNYIFTIRRDNSIIDGFENYMLTVFSDGSYMQVLIHYPLIGDAGILEPDVSNALVTYINDASLLTGIETSPCLNTTKEIMSWDAELNCVDINCSAGGNHSYGQSCDGNADQQPMRICSGGWVITGCITTSGSGSGSGTGPFSPPSGGSQNPDDPTSEIEEEVPVVPLVPAWQEIEMCVNMPSFVENIELSSDMISWLQTQPKDIVEVINIMLKEYSCNPQAQEDIFDEIEEMIENPFIETTFDIFAVDELTNDCLLGVVRDEIIINLNAGIINTIRNTLGQQTNYILAFRNNDDLNSIANAGTSMPPQGAINNGSYPIVVNFANDYLSNNPTKLSLAATTIHEMVHALLIYLYFEGELLQNYPQFTDLKAKFDAYISNRNVVTETALEDSMHVSMVDLIGAMSYALYKYAKDNGMENVTHQYCKDITRGTFFGTPAMNVITPDVNLQNDYILKAQNEQNNTSDAKGNDC